MKLQIEGIVFSGLSLFTGGGLYENHKALGLLSREERVTKAEAEMGINLVFLLQAPQTSLSPAHGKEKG